MIAAVEGLILPTNLREFPLIGSTETVSSDLSKEPSSLVDDAIQMKPRPLKKPALYSRLLAEIRGQNLHLHIPIE